MYEWEAPKDTCRYRAMIIQTIVFALLLLPLTILRLLWRLIVPYLKKINTTAYDLFGPVDGIKGYLSSTFFILLPMLVGALFYPENQAPSFFTWDTLYYWSIGFVTLAIFLTTVITIAILIVNVTYIIEDYRHSNITTKKTFLSELIRSWKEKYCKKINWK